MKVVDTGSNSLTLTQVKSLSRGSVVRSTCSTNPYLTSDGGMVCLSSGEFLAWSTFGTPRFIHYPNAEVHLK